MIELDALRYDIVIPTVGRPSLVAVLEGLEGGEGPLPERIIVVDDRADAGPPALPPMGGALGPLVTVVRSCGRGPAAARNLGWRTGAAPWVAFLDDDVEPPPDWRAALARDLAAVGDDVAASQGRITVPLPRDRRPTDWERNVATLEHAQWATADMAYRRRVLEEVRGFDERFRRAYREDADLGLRVTDAGHRIVVGQRTIRHPARPADPAVSVRMQAGNAEDPFMRVLHGRDWRRRAGVPRGRRPWHLATVGALVGGLIGWVSGHRRLGAAGGLVWTVLTADFAWRRVVPGPRSRTEVLRMLWTSVVIPVVATAHWLRGAATAPARLRAPSSRRHDPASGATADRGRAVWEGPDRPAAVLFDRDGTLIHDVPYNGDPDAVRPVGGARDTLDRLRAEGIPVGLVSNQSGIARGVVTREQVDAVNARVEELLGGFDTVQICPHGPEDGCGCRKPAAGMIRTAAAQLGVDARDCVVVGDIGSDVEAAHAAGARGVLVPNERTRSEEILSASEVADDLATVVELVLPRRSGVRAAIGSRSGDAT
jgi:histidinol-phosphate phosphatase family protein